MGRRGRLLRRRLDRRRIVLPGLHRPPRFDVSTDQRRRGQRLRPLRHPGPTRPRADRQRRRSPNDARRGRSRHAGLGTRRPDLVVDANVPTRPGRPTNAANRYRWFMSVAITEDHKALAATVADFLDRHRVASSGASAARRRRRTATRLLERSRRTRLARPARPRAVRRVGLRRSRNSWWSSRNSVAGSRPARSCRRWSPVPSSPRPATGDLEQRLLPGLADGSVAARSGSTDRSRSRTARVSGRVDAVIGVGLADVLLVAVRRRRRHRRHLGRWRHDRHPDQPRRHPACRPSHLRRRHGRRASPGARQTLVDDARTIFAAEAVGDRPGVHRTGGRVRQGAQQFGRPIAMFQAVKHHCANMLVATELATAAVWDAARASDGRRRSVLADRGDRRHARHSPPPTCAPT